MTTTQGTTLTSSYLKGKNRFGIFLTGTASGTSAASSDATGVIILSAGVVLCVIDFQQVIVSL